MELTAPEAWSRVLERARPLLPAHTFSIWLEHTEPMALSHDQLVVAAGSDFAAEWIDDKYGDLLAEVAERVLGRPIDLTFRHHPRESAARVRVSGMELDPMTGAHVPDAPMAPAQK